MPLRSWLPNGPCFGQPHMYIYVYKVPNNNNNNNNHLRGAYPLQPARGRPTEGQSKRASQ